MSSRPYVDLLCALGEGGSTPTADQIERFAQLTPEERFHGLVDLLALCYELATPEARASWHEHKAAQR